MLLRLWTALALIGLVIALPVDEPGAQLGTPLEHAKRALPTITAVQRETFDNRLTSDTALVPVGTDKNITWQSFVYATYRNGLLSQINPNTYPYAAASSAAISNAEGFTDGPAIVLDPTSKYTSFALSSFAYGCLNSANAPIPCVITLAGRKTTGGLTIQTANFQGGANLATVALGSGWSRLVSVAFATKTTSGSSVPLTLVLDTVGYTLTNSTA